MVDPVEAFETLDLRIGRVVSAELNEAARKPAYRLRIDFGDEAAGGLGVRDSSAQLTDLYAAEELVGRQVIAAMNLGEKLIAGVRSTVLVLGVPDEEGRVVLLSAERDVPPGGSVY
jgi:tRNA-binding protein